MEQQLLPNVPMLIMQVVLTYMQSLSPHSSADASAPLCPGLCLWEPQNGNSAMLAPKPGAGISCKGPGCPQMMQRISVFLTMVTAVDMEAVVASTYNYCLSLQLAKCQKYVRAQHPFLLRTVSRLTFGKSSFLNTQPGWFGSCPSSAHGWYLVTLRTGISLGIGMWPILSPWVSGPDSVEATRKVTGFCLLLSSWWKISLKLLVALSATSYIEHA